jgi:hypothetical protein
VDVRTLLFILAGFLLVVAVVLVVLTTSSRCGGAVTASDRPPRPWWGNPITWIVAGSAFTIVGLFVLPKLFGFAFLFLPLIWLGRFGSRRWSTNDDEQGRGPDDDPSWGG